MFGSQLWRLRERVSDLLFQEPIEFCGRLGVELGKERGRNLMASAPLYGYSPIDS